MSIFEGLFRRQRARVEVNGTVEHDANAAPAFPDLSAMERGTPVAAGGGYLNLSEYSVRGKNASSGRMKTLKVCAADEGDAESAADGSGLRAPFEVCLIPATEPSEAQLRFARDAGISVPPHACSLDISALLDRYQNGGDASVVPASAVAVATQKRIQVSLLSSRTTFSRALYGRLSLEDRAALYCYAVYCKITGTAFGGGDITAWCGPFAGFAKIAMSAESFKRYLSEHNGDALRAPNKASAIYAAAVNYLRSLGGSEAS